MSKFIYNLLITNSKRINYLSVKDSEICTACDETPSPSPSPAVIEVSYQKLLPLPPNANDCQASNSSNQYGSTTINIPEEFSLPVNVSITGSIDDELVIDGIIVQSGQYPGGDCYDIPGGCNGCNGAHAVDYTFECDQSSFTLAVGDNHGADVYYYLTITITEI